MDHFNFSPCPKIKGTKIEGSKISYIIPLNVRPLFWGCSENQVAHMLTIRLRRSVAIVFTFYVLS